MASHTPAPTSSYEAPYFFEFDYIQLIRSDNQDFATISSKFLSYGSSASLEELTDGSFNLNVSSVTVGDLVPSLPTKTDADRKLISGLITPADISVPILTNPLQATLICEDVETDTVFSVNDELSKIDNFNASAPNVTSINGSVECDDVKCDTIFDPTASSLISLSDDTINLQATDVQANGNSILTSADGDFVRKDDPNPQTMIGDLQATRFSTGLSVRIGEGAGLNNQSLYGISIGSDSGKNNQKQHSVAIGTGAGFDSIGDKTVCLGYNAGRPGIPSKSIALGADAFPPRLKFRWLFWFLARQKHHENSEWFQNTLL